MVGPAVRPGKQMEFLERPEGPEDGRPGRQAGKIFGEIMSAESATLYQPGVKPQETIEIDD